jgi:type I restriction enzyme S subunit
MINKMMPKVRFEGFSQHWELKCLGDLCVITTGKLDANAMVENGDYDFYTSGIKKYKIDVPAFEGPAITVAGNGATAGYMHLADGLFNAYQRTYVLTNFLANREFLYQVIGNELPRTINQEARKGNIPYIVMNMLTNLKIFIPKNEEQQKIGEFFKQLDDRITLQQSHVEQLKQSKQGFLQKMFPKDGESVPEVRFDNFHDKWIEHRLSDGMTEYTDRVIIENHKKYNQVSVKNIGEITLRGEKKGSEIGRKRQSKVNLKDFPVTLIFTRQTIEQGGIGFAPIETDGAIVTENMPTISINTKIFDKEYLRIFFKTEVFRKKVILPNIQGGTAQIAIHEDNIISSTVPFPHICEQQKIGEFFKKLDDLIAKNERELELLQETKKGFLQKMFV